MSLRAVTGWKTRAVIITIFSEWVISGSTLAPVFLEKRVKLKGVVCIYTWLVIDCGE